MRVPVQFGKEVSAGSVLGRHLVAKAASQLLDLVGGLRQLVERTIVDNAEPALHAQQETVARTQGSMVFRGQQSCVAQGVEGLPGIGFAQRRQAAAILQLEKLDEELDVDEP